MKFRAATLREKKSQSHVQSVNSETGQHERNRRTRMCRICERKKVQVRGRRKTTFQRSSMNANVTAESRHYQRVGNAENGRIPRHQAGSNNSQGDRRCPDMDQGDQKDKPETTSRASSGDSQTVTNHTPRTRNTNQTRNSTTTSREVK